MRRRPPFSSGMSRSAMVSRCRSASPLLRKAPSCTPQAAPPVPRPTASATLTVWEGLAVEVEGRGGATAKVEGDPAEAMATGRFAVGRGAGRSTEPSLAAITL